MEGLIVKTYIRGFILCGTLFLSGCTFGSTTDEELSKVLTEMNEAEEVYRDAQSELHAIEQTEQSLFNDMMALTQEEEEELKEKVVEIEKLLEQRLVHIEEEEDSMKKAMKSVESLDGIVEKAEEDIKGDVEKLRDTATDRYALHSTFVEEYKKLTEAQKELYELLIIEEADLPTLEKQVGEVNNQNDKVKSLIETFNEATVSLNKIKDETFSFLKENEDK